MTAILSLRGEKGGGGGKQGEKQEREDEMGLGQILVWKWKISASLKKHKLLMDLICF